MDANSKIELTENALTVLERRYLRRNSDGIVIETPEEMFRRVARHIAEADRNYGGSDPEIESTADCFYEAMASLEFLPNSPTLMNAGRPNGQLSACFVLPVGDSMEEIFETNKHAALIHKSGGGTGFSFSRLRPRNSVVASTSGVASGPISFLKVFDASTDAVKQGGTRRGANMGVLRIDHPDIIEFIQCKDDTTEIINFNLSVAVTDQFMKALADDAEYPLIDPRTDNIYETDGRQVHLKASQVWEMIVDRSWRTGEPGVIFIDRMNKTNPTAPSETIEATNPCGEQPLPPYDSCNLGSINLGRFVLPDYRSGDEPEKGIDWKRLGERIKLAVHFLDNVIDRNRYPIDLIAEQTTRNRRIGLGIMGWADMLVKLGLGYNSEQAQRLGEKVMAFVQSEGHSRSSDLVRSRGKFPNWEGSIYKQQGVAMRNATVTTVAPTGTISIIANCSSGVEPFYSLVYERRVLDGSRLREVNPLFVAASQSAGCFDDDLTEFLARGGSLADREDIPKEIKELFVTAHEISPEDHLKMQSAFQAHCDSSVSKTINFPASASRDEVRQSFDLAYALGCKGVTIYRDRSRPNQVLSTDGPLEQKPESLTAAADAHTVPDQTATVADRPNVLTGFTEKIRTGYGNLYVTVNVRKGEPFEVFAQIGKSGYSTMADTEAICRLISLSLRSGVPVGRIVKQLRGIGGSAQVYSNGTRITSIPDAIAQVLQRRFLAESSDLEPSDSHGRDICPDCSAILVVDSGCMLCSGCGYSSC